MTRKLSLLMTALVGLLVFTACGPSRAEKLNQEGNEAYLQQTYDQALALYQSAQIEEPTLAEPYYNAASAHYRQGDYAAALEQLQQALAFADEETLAQASFFNLGNSAYSAQDNANAIAAYTEALLINPDDADAKYNLELALQQQQQQEQEQEQEEQEQDQQEQQDQESEGGEGEEEQEQQENQDQSDESEGGEGDQEQESQSQEGEDESEEGQDGEQNESDQSEGEGEEEGEQSEEGEESQDEQGQNGEEEGDESEQDGQQGDQPQDQQGDQSGQGQPGEEDPNGEEQPGMVPAPGERMSEEQARQLLATIAGDSDTLAERLGQIFSAPWQPPVQDW